MMLRRDRSYFVINHPDSTSMHEFLNLFFNRQSAYLWVQTFLLFSSTYLCIRMRQASYRGFSRKTKKTSGSFNVTFHYKADVLSLNIARLADFVARIYSIELEIKDYTSANRYASYLDLHLEVYSEGRLRPKPYDLIDRFGKSVSKMATGMTYLS